LTQLKETKTHLLLFTESKEVKLQIDKLLSALRPGAKFEPRVESGADDGYTRFYDGQKYKNGFLFKISNGFKQKLLDNIKFDETDLLPDINMPDRMEFLKRVMPELPFKPYKHQLKGFLHLTSDRNVFASMCTSAGKSLVAYLLLRYFRERNKRIIILVPTISLVSQFFNDCKDYNASHDFLDNIELIGGEFNGKKLDKDIVISTYQSLVKLKDRLKDFDCILVDEAHLAGSDSYTQILDQGFEINMAMTGSVPIIKVDSMAIEKVFGKPNFIIKARELMDQGLLTDSTITPLFLNYSKGLDGLKSGMNYQKEVTFIKESETRRNFVKELFNKLPGLSVGLYAHTEQGMETYKSITGEYPTFGKKSMDRMKELGVYFVSGKTKGSIREEIRKHTNTIDTGIIIANFKVFSTGINLPNLANIILLSSTKSYVTVLQSLGRVFRLRNNKTHARIFDLIDVFPYKKESYSLKHFWERLKAYNQEDHRIIEKEINLEKYK